MIKEELEKILKSKKYIKIYTKEKNYYGLFISIIYEYNLNIVLIKDT